MFGREGLGEVLRMLHGPSWVPLANARTQLGKGSGASASLPSGHAEVVTYASRSGRTGGTKVVEELSPREAEVPELVGRHLSNPQIAERLYISVRTVESHIASLIRKLGVADRRALGPTRPSIIPPWFVRYEPARTYPRRDRRSSAARPNETSCTRWSKPSPRSRSPASAAAGRPGWP
jgi:DNA-binding CsgD family transcriptional regulator